MPAEVKAKQTWADAAQAAIQMRRLYLDICSKERFAQATVNVLGEHHASLSTAAASHDINHRITKLRTKHARPLTYKQRHESVDRAKKEVVKAEAKLLVRKRQALSKREFKELRQRSVDRLSRARTKSAHPARNSSKSNGHGGATGGKHARHLELAGERPLEEFVSRLSTPEILECGLSKSKRLSKDQRNRRAALVRKDLPVLEAIMLVLLNSDQPGASIFNFSYSLAVGASLRD